MSFYFSDLIDYTAWERESWLNWFRQRDPNILKISAGPNGDGRFEVVGDLVRHIFSAEKRYVERLTGRSLTDTASVPNDDVEALFEFGRRSREELTELIRTFPAADWDTLIALQILSYAVKASPRKIVTHVLMHEIRHWAQIATLLRLNGVVADFHDFLGSPVMGGEWRKTGEP